MRRFCLSIILVLMVWVSGPVAGFVGDDGLHKQDWFHLSFLELEDDLQTAHDEGKHLMVLFEQAGCPYCRELHEVNFQSPDIVKFLNDHFLIVQIDMWGSRDVVTLDGDEIDERQLARDWRVNFTPSSVFLYGDRVNGAHEVFRTPGYLKPFHFLSSLEYVAGQHYRNVPFQRYLQQKLVRYRAEGKPIEIW